MKYCDRTPEPIIKRKIVKELHPTCDTMMEAKAKMWGYSDNQSKIVGDAQELVKNQHKPVAFDTNKTRRKMIKPTEKGSY